MTTSRPADLASLFGPGPDPASQDLRYRQGTVLTFNEVTLQNTIQVGSTVLTDVPLLGVGEASLLTTGSVVGVLVVGGDTKQYYITGRIVVPNTPDAADAISLLSVLTTAAETAADETTSSTTYTDLGTVGPSVAVTVGPSGRLSITVGAIIGISLSSGSGTDQRAGFMSYQIVGPTNVSALDENSAAFETSYSNAGASFSEFFFVSASRTTVQEGLTPGTGYVITAKYRCIGALAEFLSRSISVTRL